MKKLPCLASSLLAVLLLASPAYAADTSDQDIAALKAQIAKLSQKVDQLQVQAKQAKEVKAVAATPAPAPAPVVASVPAPVVAPASAPVSSSDVVTKGSFPGSFHVPGTNTSVKIGGYVKVDAIEDIGSAYGANYARFYQIPLKTDPRTQQGGQTTFGAQQTRLNLETRTPSEYGEIRTYVEGDFYGTTGANGNTNGYGFELRHAYGSIGSTATGQVLAGQTWSNFMDTKAMPESMDYLGPAATIFVRQPQVRFTHAVGPVVLSASAEEPIDASLTSSTVNAIESANTVTSGALTPVSTTHSQMPDLVARGDYNYDSSGYVSLRALANQVDVDRTVSTTNNDSATKYGFGVAISGVQGVLSKDAILYDFVAGNGTGRYVYDVGATGNYYNSSTNTLKTQPYYGGTLGYQHYWSEHFRSNLFGGAVRIVNDTNIMTAPVEALANKFVASGHANLIWQPSPAYMVGIEYMRGYREVESGIEGTLNRTEASFIYNF